jgi:alanyl-tRNA synthetase
MVIRRAARFATKIGLGEPFLADVAEIVIENYGEAYPELVQNKNIIIDSLTREERQFKRVLTRGIIKLDNLIEETIESGQTVLDGTAVFRLSDTDGLPYEVTRDIIIHEYPQYDLKIDDAAFQKAKEAHRIASGGGDSIGPLGGEDAEVFQKILNSLVETNKLDEEGVNHDPYHELETSGELLALVKDGKQIKTADMGDDVEIILPNTSFYVAAGGQVADTGLICAADGSWEFEVTDIRQPAAGMIAQQGKVTKGKLQVGDAAKAQVDPGRRQDIIRNHTATHLLHAELHRVLGDHARQAGSLVAPDRLRFDFQHPEAVIKEELAEIEAGVNQRILENFPLKIEFKSLDEAKAEGAIALFGEKYGDTVRTIQIGGEDPFSYELCGGTHVESTGEIGTFLIVSESSVASGIRRIEAITGRAAYALIQKRNAEFNRLAALLKTTPDQVLEKTGSLAHDLNEAQKEINALRHTKAADSFSQQIENAPEINGVRVLSSILPEADRDTLREMADRFRQKYESGVAVLASVIDGKPAIIAAVTDNLVKQGWHAGELVKIVSEPVGGSGGGRPNLAQAGGKDAAKLEEALALTAGWVEEKTQK